MYFTKEHKVLIDKLQELCPTTFPKKPAKKVPLAHGQHKAIQRALDIPWHTADELLTAWCRGRRYDEVMVAGAPRYRIDGTVSGKVSHSQAMYHKECLDEYLRNRAVGEAKYCKGSISDYYASRRQPKRNVGFMERLLRFFGLSTLSTKRNSEYKEVVQ